jgi:hypothetical protein
MKVLQNAFAYCIIHRRGHVHMVAERSRGICLVLFICILGPASAASAVEKEIEIGSLMSNYVWRGVRLSEGLVGQSSVTLRGKGLSLNLWGNYDFDLDKLNETDVTFSYSRDIDKLSLETGLIHYAIIGGHDSDELFLGLNANYPLQPSIKAYFDVNAGKGAFLQASVGHSLRLASRLALDMRASMGLVFNDSYMGLPDTGEEFAGLHNAEILIACPVQLSKAWVLKLQAGASTPLSRNARQAIINGSACQPGQRLCNGTMVYGGATLAYSF